MTLRNHLAGLALLALVFLFAVAGADSQDPAPVPSPTDAAAQAARQVTVEGRGPIPVGVEPEAGKRMAREAALLQAYRRLVEDGLKAWGFGFETTPRPGESLHFAISADHPNDRLLAWALRSTVTREADWNGEVRLQLTSPPLGELSSANPHLVKTTTHDLDRDGIPETVGAGYDGRVYVLTRTASGWDILGSTPSHSEYASTTYAGTTPWEHVRLSRLESILTVEPAGQDRARVVVRSLNSEQIDSHYAGSSLEEREIVVTLRPKHDDPTIVVEEPFDFSTTSEQELALKGVVHAPAGLEKAELFCNGRQLWRSPEGLTSQNLKMDVVVQLVPGINRVRIEALDKDRRSTDRELLIRRRDAAPPLMSKQRAALVVGIEKYRDPNLPEVPGAVEDARQIAQTLRQGADFPADKIALLTNEQATGTSIEQALQTLGAGEEKLLVVYFAGLSAPGALSGGKALVPWDGAPPDGGALGPTPLRKALGPLGDRQAVLILDVARHSEEGSQLESRWLDNDEFMRGFSEAGWVVLTTSDPTPAARSLEETKEGILTAALREALQGKADSNRDGKVEMEEAYRYICSRMQQETLRRKLPPQPPLLRGQLYGRLPLSSAE